MPTLGKGEDLFYIVCKHLMFNPKRHSLNGSEIDSDEEFAMVS